MTHEEYDALEEIVGGSYNRGYADGLKTGHEGGYRSGYEKGLEDVWKCANKINDMNAREFEEVFGYTYYAGCMEIVSPSEALQKIKEYEERQKQDEKSCGTCKHFTDTDEVHGYTPCNADLHNYEPKQTDDTDSDKIKVGDEIVDGQGRKVIVTQLSKLDGKDILKGFDGEGCPWNAIIPNIWYKTGRHFPQIVEVLELLEG